MLRKYVVFLARENKNKYYFSKLFMISSILIIMSNLGY
ncbi:hypothetical protein A1OE_1056 [Candidatus Endolissoclinum faulkneri L2]|uniref:Uncharacterized protein n=1 Tax=Candidatus Endolissoclinum faulkneri L2 TaxID=1193729 RepID=K7YRQ4_9PROT|nr:hypothetical protein A1OE_1056 [Candidatus Endolissoclinum faulkneri L2]